MKKYLKIARLVIGVIALVYSLVNDYKYIYTLISVLVVMSIIPYLLLIMRNLKISTSVYKNRFFWLYPLIVFFSLVLFITLKFLFPNKVPLLIIALIVISTSLVVGFIWGYLEKRKLKGLNQNNFLTEYVNLLNDDFDTIEQGILTLDYADKISFITKSSTLFDFGKSEIENVLVEVVYKIFPVSFSIQLKDGKLYHFDGEFPFLWQQVLKN